MDIPYKKNIICLMWILKLFIVFCNAINIMRSNKQLHKHLSNFHIMYFFDKKKLKKFGKRLMEQKYLEWNRKIILKHLQVSDIFGINLCCLAWTLALKYMASMEHYGLPSSYISRHHSLLIYRTNKKAILHSSFIWK